MANATLSDYTNVATDRFNKAVPIYLHNKVPLLKIFNQGKTEGFDAEKNFILPFQYQQPHGTNWTVEGAATPTALLSKFEQMTLSWKKFVGAIRLSEESIDLTKGSKTFIDGWSRESAGLLRTIKNDLDTALHRRGTGSLCTAASYSGQVVTVDSTKYLEPGMVLDGYDSSDNQDVNGCVVTSIDSATTFTCTGTVTSVDAGTLFYKEGSWVTGLDRAAMGIDGIVDDDAGTFQGLSRDTYGILKAKVTDGSTPGTNEALTLARMRGVIDSISTGSYNGTPDCIYTSIGGYNAYTDIMRSANQPIETMPAKDGFPGGAKYHQGNKVLPVIASSKAEANTMFFLSKPTLFKYFGKQGWADKDGVMQRVAGYLIYESLYRGFCNFGTTWPEANGRLNDITET